MKQRDLIHTLGQALEHIVRFVPEDRLQQNKPLLAYAFKEYTKYCFHRKDFGSDVYVDTCGRM